MPSQNQYPDPKTITVNGETKTISEWSKENKIRKDVIYRRLQHGWDEQRAVTEQTAVGKARSEANRQRAIELPQRQLKQQFAVQLAKALHGLGESEVISILQDKFKDDPIKFIEKVLIPIFPKDDLDRTSPNQTAAAFHIEFNGTPLNNPVIDIMGDDDQ